MTRDERSRHLRPESLTRLKMAAASLAVATIAGGWDISAGPRLVRYDPLPADEAEYCEWTPAADAALIRIDRLEAHAAASEHVPPGAGDRAPIRTIHDRYPSYSAVAVDTLADEVVLQDENLFGLKVFRRLDDTPPTAALTEPKRVVGGGKTFLEYNCALYIDPKTGDVFSVNNDTVDRLVVFPRTAEGDAVPARVLHTPHRAFGIAMDEERGEMFLTVQHPPAVFVYRKTASGEDQPLRILEGPRTELEDPHGIAIDTKNRLMFVVNHGSVAEFRNPKVWSSFAKVPSREPDDLMATGTGRFEPPSITVYDLDAGGDTAPRRIIEGPKTRLNWPSLVAIDETRGELFVANDLDDSIVVFRASDGGDVAPVRTIKGPKTGIRSPTGVFVDTKNDELWVANFGNHSATVFAPTANGDVTPLRTIRSAPVGKLATSLGNPGALAYDSKRQEILVPN